VIAVLFLVLCLYGVPAHAMLQQDMSEGYQQGSPQPPPTLPGEPDPLPDLRTLSPFNLVLVEIPSSGRRLLRFSNSISNEGMIDLQLTGRYDHKAGAYKVAQNLPVQDGGFEFVELGERHIEYHPEHYHWHLDDFARYEVWTAAPGGVLRNLMRTNGKVSYCIMDTDRLPGTEHASGYHSCGPSLQGLSVGWADTYERHLPGQWVDISGLPDGFYALRSIVDPFDFLWETNELNNDVLLTFHLHDGQIKNIQNAPPDWSQTRPQPDPQASLR
jgi:hypothetical protein